MALPSPARRARCAVLAFSSAGLISLECATVTENSGPSSFSSQNARKSFSAGNFGNRS